MRANRNVSRAETRFRKALWGAGARGYRRGSWLPGRPDIVFPAIRLAIFVNGCYWHQCPSCQLPQPKANAEFWREKFARNIERDRAAESALAANAWKVMTIWEHELRADVEGTANRTARFIAEERLR